MENYSLYHLYYGGEEYGKITPELWKEEEFKISVNENIIKAIYPDGKSYEIPLSSEYKKAYIIRFDYDKWNNIKDKSAIIKEFDLDIL